jgi:competence protein ComEC
MVALYAGVLLAWAVAPTPEGRSIVAALRALPVARPAAIAVATFFATSALVLGANAATDSTLTISVLDVGEGDAVLLRTPAQQTVLIDGGRDPAALLNQLGRRLGIVERTLSIAILTAADPERLPGSIAALERYPAGLAISPPEGAPSGLYERWRAAIAGSLQLTSEASAVIDLEPGLSMDLIPTAPLSSPWRPDGPPLRTLIVRILHGEVTTLMAPSLTPDGARQALAEGWSLSAQALIVPRHGDSTLNRALIGAVDPSLAVISAGARSRQGHPSPQALAALEGIPTYRTDLHGTIEIRSDGRKQWVVTER